MQIQTGLAEGQVLQRLGARGANAQLSGAAAETGPVLATIRGKRGVLKGWNRRRVGQARAGKFTARLQSIPAGGPYQLELSVGKSVACVKAFFVGDVWLLAGQSNMEGCGNHLGAAKSHPLIRAFSMRREWRPATEPLHILGESPDTCHTATQCTPERGEELRRTAIKGTGAGLFFAHEMLKRSGVPQALICTSHGGTSMQQWNPARKGEKGASLYGSMLLSLAATAQPVAGMLWYQGESDTNPEDAALYTERMKKLVAATRRDLRQPGLPWVIVQIARFYSASIQSDPPRMIAWNKIQDEERLLPERVARLETVPAIDLPLDDFIHIGAAGFPRLAARLARMADRLVYRNAGEKPPLRLKSISEPFSLPSENSFAIDIQFENAVGGLRSNGEPGGFVITDGSGRDLHLPFKTTLHGSSARLHLPAGQLPPNCRLSYGFGPAPTCSLVDARDMAVPVFGPVRISKPSAHFPFVTTWRTTGILTDVEPLAKLKLPELDGRETTVKTYANQPLEGFVNEHPAWEGKSGQAYFASRVELPEPMKLEVLAGYDGPFRLWLDGKLCIDALDGINPCFADKSRKTVSLPAGSHDLRVAMDLADGKSWGFFVRFRRLDVTPRQIENESYAKPVYLV